MSPGGRSKRSKRAALELQEDEGKAADPTPAVVVDKQSMSPRMSPEVYAKRAARRRWRAALPVLPEDWLLRRVRTHHALVLPPKPKKTIYKPSVQLDKLTRRDDWEWCPGPLSVAKVWFSEQEALRRALMAELNEVGGEACDIFGRDPDPDEESGWTSVTESKVKKKKKTPAVNPLILQNPEHDKLTAEETQQRTALHEDEARVWVALEYKLTLAKDGLRARMAAKRNAGMTWQEMAENCARLRALNNKVTVAKGPVLGRKVEVKALKVTQVVTQRELECLQRWQARRSAERDEGPAPPRLGVFGEETAELWEPAEGLCKTPRTWAANDGSCASLSTTQQCQDVVPPQHAAPPTAVARPCPHSPKLVIATGKRVSSPGPSTDAGSARSSCSESRPPRRVSTGKTPPPSITFVSVTVSSSDRRPTDTRRPPGPAHVTFSDISHFQSEAMMSTSVNTDGARSSPLRGRERTAATYTSFAGRVLPSESAPTPAGSFFRGIDGDVGGERRASARTRNSRALSMHTVLSDTSVQWGLEMTMPCMPASWCPESTPTGDLGDEGDGEGGGVAAPDQEEGGPPQEQSSPPRLVPPCPPPRLQVPPVSPEARVAHRAAGPPRVQLRPVVLPREFAVSSCFAGLSPRSRSGSPWNLRREGEEDEPAAGGAVAIGRVPLVTPGAPAFAAGARLSESSNTTPAIAANLSEEEAMAQAEAEAEEELGIESERHLLGALTGLVDRLSGPRSDIPLVSPRQYRSHQSAGYGSMRSMHSAHGSALPSPKKSTCCCSSDQGTAAATTACGATVATGSARMAEGGTAAPSYSGATRTGPLRPQQPAALMRALLPARPAPRRVQLAGVAPAKQPVGSKQSRAAALAEQKRRERLATRLALSARSAFGTLQPLSPRAACRDTSAADWDGASRGRLLPAPPGRRPASASAAPQSLPRPAAPSPPLKRVAGPRRQPIAGLVGVTEPHFVPYRSAARA
eukprot:TRINITY_DN923_c1_g1_i1.p1 TRINITY_DN923_c1_g1~~TRINITY_DN923_c1_g1_i1.p1  ORF type:complete len:1103 (+),score=186.14 TRINITY_DN923_c1_g1_i1:385-3309(+)